MTLGLPESTLQELSRVASQRVMRSIAQLPVPDPEDMRPSAPSAPDLGAGFVRALWEDAGLTPPGAGEAQSIWAEAELLGRSWDGGQVRGLDGKTRDVLVATGVSVSMFALAVALEAALEGHAAEQVEGVLRWVVPVGKVVGHTLAAAVVHCATKATKALRGNAERDNENHNAPVDTAEGD